MLAWRRAGSFQNAGQTARGPGAGDRSMSVLLGSVHPPPPSAAEAGMTGPTGDSEDGRRKGRKCPLIHLLPHNQPPRLGGSEQPRSIPPQPFS